MSDVQQELAVVEPPRQGTKTPLTPKAEAAGLEVYTSRYEDIAFRRVSDRMFVVVGRLDVAILAQVNDVNFNDQAVAEALSYLADYDRIPTWRKRTPDKGHIAIGTIYDGSRVVMTNDDEMKFGLADGRIIYANEVE